MSFLTPAFLLAGLLAIPIAILYMLRLRRREMLVSSTLLWQMVLRDREANRPWQRLRRNLLLLLQLLLLAAIVLALARPFVPVPVIAAGQVTLLLDGSASMRATDVQPSRFVIAQQAADQIVDGLASDGVMTVILAAQQPQVLISGSADKTRLHEAIARAEPFVGEADWAAALSLAAGAAGTARNPTTVIISDGGLPDEIRAIPGDVRYVPIGVSGDNLGISALSVRPDIGGLQLYTGITNYGPQNADTILSITVDGVLVSARRYTVPAGETLGVNLTLAAGRLVEARIAPPAGAPVADYFALDDRAWAAYVPPQTGRVLHVSQDGNIFVEQVLAVLPDIQPFRTSADEPLPAEPFEVYIFDGVVPDALPPADTLIINPPAPGNELVTVGAEYRPHLLSTIEVADHPLTRFVDWGNVQFLRVHNVQPVPELETELEIIARIDERPLMLAGEVGRHRVAILTFDVRDSNLPLQVSFPILFANLLDWLSPATVIAAAGDVVNPGDPVRIVPEVSAAAVAVVKPDGL
ncbi:MAG: VWA domain-containing protein, partial [Anaerolineales bacterium]